MWITHPTSGNIAGMLEFKKEFFVESVPERAEIKVCADTKYRLYVNGKFVLLGPCKRSPYTTFYDTVDIAPFLKSGSNKISALVAHIPAQEETKDGFLYYTTLIRSPFASLMLEGAGLETDAGWLVSVCPEFEYNMNLSNILSGGFDIVDYNKKKRKFVAAKVLMPARADDHINVCGEFLSVVLKKRTIPLLTHKRCEFVSSRKENNKIIFNAGAETTGVIHLNVSGEKGSKIKILFAESYYFKDKDGKIKKDVRDDERGILSTPRGDYYDEIILDGKKREYETFSIRTFRFVQIEISGNASVENVCYYEIKYPLVVVASFASDDKDAQALWETSIRTLNDCMHDSFEDCPYYEQMQYQMDSRLEGLYQRQLSPDRALIKKCITDFRESALPDGMVQARISATRQIIPGFAFHYVYMIHDYMLYDGDREFIKSLIPAIDGIFEWMEERKQNGVLGALGKWSYLDWVDEWPGGIPDTVKPLSEYNLMYITALTEAAALARFAGRNALALEYDERAAELRKSVRKVFFNEERGLYMDTPDGGYSMHGQVWAVLADVATGEEAESILNRSIDEGLPVCSYSMMFFVFRALEKANLYSRAYKLLDGWRKMLEKHCTTWVENGLDGRSECHGWGSVPIYEFSAVILGVRPAAAGYSEVLVKPYIGANAFAEGTVSTSNGLINVAWRKENGSFSITVSAEFDAPVRVCLPDNTEHIMQGRRQAFSCRL